MMETLTAFLMRSSDGLILAFAGLVKPAIFFLLLGMLVKGKTLFADMRRALHQTTLNLQIMVFNLVLVVPIIGLGSVFLYGLVQSNDLYLVVPSTWLDLPFWLVLFIGVFVDDFVGYWRHRLEHTALFWPSHAVHHSDTEMTWLSLQRFHPINRVTTFFIGTVAILSLGFPVEVIIAGGLIRHYYGYFIHADLPWTYGPFGRVFVSPAMHRWHHAADKAAFDTNYATIFSVFDQAFGTFRVPGPCTAPLGVTDPIAPTLRSQLSYAFTPGAYRRMFRATTAHAKKPPLATDQ